MQITPQILSLPPYLSTGWDNIASLRSDAKEGIAYLYVTLKNGEIATVPGLSEQDIRLVFDAHAKFSPGNTPFKMAMPFSFSLPLKKEGPLASLGNSMRHNPEQSDLPEIPPEILNKVVTVAKAFGFNDFSNLQPSEPDCNCMYCQLHRTLGLTESLEEKISDHDLAFRDWEVQQISEKVYIVTSPIDKNEQYNVFLGEPLGCTCGQKKCEHIQAVLRT